jgi:hypothetical protein
LVVSEGIHGEMELAVIVVWGIRLLGRYVAQGSKWFFRVDKAVAYAKLNILVMVIRRVYLACTIRDKFKPRLCDTYTRARITSGE